MSPYFSSLIKLLPSYQTVHRVRCSIRHYSLSPYYSHETFPSRGFNLSQLSLHHYPLNILSIDFMQSLTNLFKLIQERDIPTHALIIKSSIPKIFSAGLDLGAFFIDDNSNLDNFVSYWSTFQSFWLSLYSLDIPVVSVIEGDCLAAGCLIALSSDYRIMSDGDSKIGISGTKVGIAPPIWVCKLMSHVIGVAQADRAIQLGTLFSSKQALNIKLIDQLVSQEECHNTALSVVDNFLSVDHLARSEIKRRFRRELISELMNRLDADRDDFIRIISSETTQTKIRKLLKKVDIS